MRRSTQPLLTARFLDGAFSDAYAHMRDTCVTQDHEAAAYGSTAKQAGDLQFMYYVLPEPQSSASSQRAWQYLRGEVCSTGRDHILPCGATRSS